MRELLKRDEYNVLILGLDNAGKTTLLEHTKIKFTSGYTGKPFHKITATIGLNIGNISTLVRRKALNCMTKLETANYCSAHHDISHAAYSEA